MYSPYGSEVNRVTGPPVSGIVKISQLPYLSDENAIVELSGDQFGHKSQLESERNKSSPSEKSKSKQTKKKRTTRKTSINGSLTRSEVFEDESKISITTKPKKKKSLDDFFL